MKGLLVLVESPRLGKCCVTARTDPGAGPYFDTSFTTATGERVYVSREGFEKMAELFEGQRRAVEADALRERVAALEEENLELSRQFDAIDILASKGFQARKRPGRPVKEKQNASA